MFGWETNVLGRVNVLLELLNDVGSITYVVTREFEGETINGREWEVNKSSFTRSFVVYV